MSRFKNFTPSSKLYSDDLNSIQDIYEDNFSSWKPLDIKVGIGDFAGFTSGTTYIIGSGQVLSLANRPRTISSFFVPEQYISGSRSLKIKAKIILSNRSNVGGTTLNLTFGIATFTTYVDNSANAIQTISSVASSTINNITNTQLHTTDIGPVTISDTSPRVLYVIPSATSAISTLDICGQIYYYQE
jgi:hypothetical protein